MSHYKHRNDCRLCGCQNFELVLPILPSPVGDAFVSKEQLNIKQDNYPLDTYLCLDCGHLQNLDIVDPNILFGNYTYRTANSLGLVEHFRKYASDIVTSLNIPVSSKVLEIGSNDGSLLKAFKNLGMEVQGVDPAKPITEIAIADGIPTINAFFSSELAKQIKEKSGNVALVCANNVFAHVDDISDIVKGIRLILAETGAFVFEVSYIVDMVDNLVFDTIYHEHVSHHSLIPLERFLNLHDMTLFHVERIATKGGSIRGYAQLKSTGKRENTANLIKFIAEEEKRGFTKPEVYRTFYKEIEKRKRATLDFVDEQIRNGKIVAAFGASTTTTTLIYHFELESRIKFIIDDNPIKQNLFSPGAHIPVYSSERLYIDKPDIVIIIAWQYANLIIAKHGKYMVGGGKFLIPLPELRIV